MIAVHDQLSASDRFSKRTKHLKYSELGDLVKPHRFLAREGALREYSVKQNKTKTREFFLFNDLLLKAKRTSERSLQLRGKHPYPSNVLASIFHPNRSQLVAHIRTSSLEDLILLPWPQA